MARQNVKCGVDGRLQSVIAHNLHDCLSGCLHELLVTASENAILKFRFSPILRFDSDVHDVQSTAESNRSMISPTYKLYFSALLRFLHAQSHLNCQS